MNRGKDSFEMVWRCPKCGRVFREHVFEACTSMSGPVCNACAVPLVWIAVESGRAVIDRQAWLEIEKEEDLVAEYLEDEDARPAADVRSPAPPPDFC